MIAFDTRRHRLQVVQEVRFCAFNRGWRGAVSLFQPFMSADHVERACIELRDNEKAPLVESGATLAVIRSIHSPETREPFAQILDNRGALGEDERTMLEHGNFVSGIELLESG